MLAILVVLVAAAADGGAELCLEVDDKPVPSSRVFRNGDKFAVTAKVAYPGYVHLVNVDAAGSATVLFPQGNEANQVEADTTIRLPKMEFVDPVGTEHLYLLWSPRPMADPATILDVVRQDASEALPTTQGTVTDVKPEPSAPAPMSTGSDSRAEAAPENVAVSSGRAAETAPEKFVPHQNAWFKVMPGAKGIRRVEAPASTEPCSTFELEVKQGALVGHITLDHQP